VNYERNKKGARFFKHSVVKATQIIMDIFHFVFY